MKSVTKRHSLEGALLGLALSIYAVVTLGNMTRWSIWFDEAFSAYLLRFDFVGIAHYTAADVHPPLYYWLLKIWTWIFGTGEVGLRSFSMVCIMAAIAAVYVLIRRLFGVRPAVVTVFLLAVSPMLVRFGEEARMYGLVVLVSVLGTFALVRAAEQPTRRRWLAYGTLVALGMWTHYFSAIIWLAHWVWRAVQVRRSAATPRRFIKQFFSRSWLEAHGWAVLLFLPWLPFMAIQLGTLQGGGFWIKDVTVDSILSFLTNTVLFLDHYEVHRWWAALFLALFGLFAWGFIRVHKMLGKQQQSWYELVLSLAFAPVVILFVASLPPLKPSFVERYLIPAAFWIAVLIGVTAAELLRTKRQRWLGVAIIILTAGLMGMGIANVYRYGNFNRNSWEAIGVKETIQKINQSGTDGVPIVADSPWRFYEAIYYDEPEHPVYFQATDPPYGSYNMLRDSDFRKITDMNRFREKYPRIWYIAQRRDDNIAMPTVGHWRVVRTVTASTPVTGSGFTRGFLLEAE